MKCKDLKTDLSEKDNTGKVNSEKDKSEKGQILINKYKY